MVVVATASKKILILDDDAHGDVCLRIALSKEGYQLETAANSFEAIMKMIEDMRCGIFDVDVPGSFDLTIIGWDLVGILRAFHVDGSIIVVSVEQGYHTTGKETRWHVAGLGCQTRYAAAN
jgi:DNA-binding NtrC family response regulator